MIKSNVLIFKLFSINVAFKALHKLYTKNNLTKILTAFKGRSKRFKALERKKLNFI